jgi:N-formylglutamate deformylase
MPLAQPVAGNPEVNVGTGALDMHRWERAVAAFVEALGDQQVRDHRLDVRVNVRFRGGFLCRWIVEHYPGRACPLAVEFKKVFMDEWTGQWDDAHVSELREALAVAARRTVSVLTDEM